MNIVSKILAGVAVLTIAASVQADVIWVGPSGGDWNTASNWNPANVPTSADNITINAAGSPVVLSSNGTAGNYFRGGGTLQIPTGGNLTTTFFQMNAGQTFNLDVAGGTYVTQRYYVEALNSVLNLTMTSGNVTAANRMWLDGSSSTLNLRGGTFTVGGNAMRVWGAAGGARPQLNITGSALNFTSTGVYLDNNTTTDPNTSAAVSFAFAGGDTLSPVNATNLWLDTNPITVDFTNYVNPISGNYSVTLFNYSTLGGNPTTPFATPTFIYGSSGVSNASITTGSGHVQVNFVVPEPGTLALLAFGSLAVMKFRRKKSS